MTYSRSKLRKGYRLLDQLSTCYIKKLELHVSCSYLKRTIILFVFKKRSSHSLRNLMILSWIRSYLDYHQCVAYNTQLILSQNLSIQTSLTTRGVPKSTKGFSGKSKNYQQKNLSRNVLVLMTCLAYWSLRRINHVECVLII